MARGFVAGGVSFALFAVFCVAACAWLPLWLVSRTNVVDEFCWLGEGVFETSVRWGSDLASLGLKCNPEASGAASTWDAFCGAGNATDTVIPYSDSVRSEMCSRTGAAKGLVASSLVLGALGLFAAWRAHMSLRFGAQIAASAAATAFLGGVFVLQTSLLAVMQTSPLFSQEHFSALSAGFSNPYRGVTCAYQLPTASGLLRHGSLDGPMQCLFPGPSFAFCIASMVSALFACALFALKWREALLVRRMALEHLRGRQLLGHTVDLRPSISPIFGDNVLASPTAGGAASGGAAAPGSSSCSSALSRGSRSSSTGSATPGRANFNVSFTADASAVTDSSAASALLRSPDSAATPVPGTFRYERHYSLYGAFVRRFAHRRARHLITIVPPLLNMAHVVLLGMWIMNGLAYVTRIELDQVRHVPGEALLLVLDKGNDSSSSAPSPGQAERLVAALLRELVRDMGGVGNASGLPWLRGKSFVADESLIEFAPIMTMSTFYESGSLWLGIVQLLSIFLWPVLKVLAWAWFWYTPADEVFRGRLFGWIDALGKISLANLFVNVFIACMNNFTRVLYIPWYLLPPLFVWPLHYLRVRIEFAIVPGFGTYGFVISFVLSLLMGQGNLWVHRFAKAFEEQRRAEADRSNATTSGLAAITRADSDITAGRAELQDGHAQRPGRPAIVGLFALAALDTPLFLATASGDCGADDDLDLMHAARPARLPRRGHNNTNNRKAPSGGAGKAANSARGAGHMRALDEARALDDEEGHRQPLLQQAAAADDAADAAEAQQVEQAQRSAAAQRAGAARRGAQVDDEGEAESASVRSRTPPPPPPRHSESASQRDNSQRQSESTSVQQQPSQQQQQALVAPPSQPPEELESLALCDYTFCPAQGRYLRFSQRGKACMLALQLLTLAAIVAAQLVPAWTFTRGGAIGLFIIAPEDRTFDMAVVDLPGRMANGGLQGRRPVSMALTVLVFAILMPVLHVLALCAMWWLPMRAAAQRRAMYAMEIASAWSCNDVFVFMLFASSLDVGKVSRALVEAAGLKQIDQLLERFLPGIGAFITQDMLIIWDAYALLVAAVLLEKLLEHVVHLQFATMLAERAGHRIVHGSGARTAEIIREHLDLLTPTQGYISSSMPGTFYAGLPVRVWWLMDRLGVAEEHFDDDVAPFALDS